MEQRWEAFHRPQEEQLQELIWEDERALLKERNAKAREAINQLVAENQRLRLLLEQAGVAS